MTHPIPGAGGDSVSAAVIVTAGQGWATTSASAGSSAGRAGSSSKGIDALACLGTATTPQTYRPTIDRLDRANGWSAVLRSSALDCVGEVRRQRTRIGRDGL